MIPHSCEVFLEELEENMISMHIHEKQLCKKRFRVWIEAS